MNLLELMEENTHSYLMFSDEIWLPHRSLWSTRLDIAINYIPNIHFIEKNYIEQR